MVIKPKKIVLSNKKITDDLQRQYPDLNPILGAPVTQKEIVHVLKQDQMIFVPLLY